MEGSRWERLHLFSIVGFLAFGGKPASVFVSILPPSYRDQVNTITCYFDNDFVIGLICSTFCWSVVISHQEKHVYNFWTDEKQRINQSLVFQYSKEKYCVIVIIVSEWNMCHITCCGLSKFTVMQLILPCHILLFPPDLLLVTGLISTKCWYLALL